MLRPDPLKIMNKDKDRFFMRQALKASQKAVGFSSPNPNVGAVIVKKNGIISTGHTLIPGKAHAEVNAIRKAGPNAAGSSLYVTLEPCCHFGRTSPCTDLIISSKIRNVFIGLTDPNPLVFRKGISRLKQNKIKVKTGVLSDEIEENLQWYIKYIKNKIPYITLKSGISLDGKITDYNNNSRWITSKKARAMSQELRGECDGIIAGINTIIKDDPALTWRRGEKNKQSFSRIILDTNLRISPNARVIQPDKKHSTIIAANRKSPDKRKIKLLEEKGAEILFCKTKNNHIDLQDLLKQLGDKDMAKLIVEGGSEVNYSFLKEGLADRVILFIASKLLGGVKSKGWIGSKGFLLNENKKVEKGKFYNILPDSFIFKGYMNYYVHRNH